MSINTSRKKNREFKSFFFNPQKCTNLYIFFWKQREYLNVAPDEHIKVIPVYSFMKTLGINIFHYILAGSVGVFL